MMIRHRHNSPNHGASTGLLKPQLRNLERARLALDKGSRLLDEATQAVRSGQPISTALDVLRRARDQYREASFYAPTVYAVAKGLNNIEATLATWEQLAAQQGDAK